MENQELEKIFQQWLDSQPNAWMLSRPVKKLLLQAFFEGHKQRGDR